MRLCLFTIYLGLSLEYPILDHDHNIAAQHLSFAVITFSVFNSLSSLLTLSLDPVGILSEVRS